MTQATRRVNRRQHGRSGGFTLIELLVVISIIMLLAALALPVLMKAAIQARGALCVSNVRQLATGFRAYATNHDGILPSTQGGAQPGSQPTWLFHMDPDNDAGNENETVFKDVPTRGQLFPYYRDPELVLCPSDREGNGKFSYSVPQNTAFKAIDNVVNSAVGILIIGEHPQWNIGGFPPKGGRRREGGFGCSDRPAARHGERTAMAFFDAHAELYAFDPGIQASDIYVDPWGYACGWWKDPWPNACYHGDNRPVGRTW